MRPGPRPAMETRYNLKSPGEKTGPEGDGQAGRKDLGFWNLAPRSYVGRRSGLGSRFRALRESAGCRGGAGRRAGRPGSHPLQSPGPADAQRHELRPFLLFVAESWGHHPIRQSRWKDDVALGWWSLPVLAALAPSPPLPNSLKLFVL